MLIVLKTSGLGLGVKHVERIARLRMHVWPERTMPRMLAVYGGLGFRVMRVHAFPANGVEIAVRDTLPQPYLASSQYSQSLDTPAFQNLPCEKPQISHTHLRIASCTREPSLLARPWASSSQRTLLSSMVTSQTSRYLWGSGFGRPSILPLGPLFQLQAAPP